MNTQRGPKTKKRPLTGSAQRFRHIFEHSPAMVYLSDTAGFILDMNEAGVTMLGYGSPEEVLGLEAAHHLYAEPGDRLRFLKTIEQTGSVQDFETRFRRCDGTILDVRITATTRRNGKGRVEGYEGFVLDVTDRKRAEQALQESEEKYRIVVENSLSAIFIHQQGVFRFVNHRFAEMLGYDTTEEVIGRHFWEFVHPDDRSLVKERGLNREKSQVFPLQYTLRAIKKDGSTIWVDLRATHATYLGQSAVVGNCIDITQSKASEEEIHHLSRRLIEVSEEEKKGLAADLHDEFGQALTSLHFDLEALQSSITDGFTEQKQRCSGLLQRVEMLADSVRKTTSYLRPDLLDHLGLVPTLEWFIHEFNVRWPDIRLEFQSLGLKKRLSQQIEIVLYRIFQECLTNISKHAKATQVEIMLTYSHPRVIFTIRDNGVGYETSPHPSSPVGPVRGIGLPSMRERVASCGGTIDIASIPGKGTTIRASIPVL
ncbi:MAG: PAS domain S-box protein [Deltaproteobacteria bacterium]|nr:PAS domain S-box protein [Deltaproteobacteria bacterium]